MARTLQPTIRDEHGVLERASTTVTTVHGEVVVIGTAIRTLGLVLKSTYLSNLGDGPVAVSHLLRARGNDPIVEQRVAGELAGVTFGTRCLLDHLDAVRQAAETLSDMELSVEIPDAQFERLHDLTSA